MSTKGYKWLTAVLAVMVALLVFCLWEVAWHATYAKWDARDARLAVKRIERLRYEALKTSPEQSSHYLEEIMTCYSPWKWKRPDLFLERLVESQRTNAIHDVIDYLRIKTGKDLGDTPETWIERYVEK